MQGQNETAVVSSEQPLRSCNLIPGPQQPDCRKAFVHGHPGQIIHTSMFSGFAQRTKVWNE